MGTCVVIHANPDIDWHRVRGDYFAAGFRCAGIPYHYSRSLVRESDSLPLLLGTTFWRQIENDGGDFILVDRCSFGDTNRFVSLVRNGHGLRGDHRVPHPVDGWRWQKYGESLKPWRKSGKRIVVCGQTEPYSPHYPNLEVWYNRVVVPSGATHFRNHPAGHNPTRLPEIDSWKDVKCAITLNSSIGVQAVLDGVPTVAMDEASMAWEVTSHSFEAPMYTPERMPWCQWLAWTQWTDEEIREGRPWGYLI